MGASIWVWWGDSTGAWAGEQVTGFAGLGVSVVMELDSVLGGVWSGV